MEPDTEPSVLIPQTPSNHFGLCPNQGQTVRAGESRPAEEPSKHSRFKRDMWKHQIDKEAAGPESLSTVLLFYSNIRCRPCDHIFACFHLPIIFVWVPQKQSLRQGLGCKWFIWEVISANRSEAAESETGKEEKPASRCVTEVAAGGN